MYSHKGPDTLLDSVLLILYRSIIPNSEGHYETTKKLSCLELFDIIIDNKWTVGNNIKCEDIQNLIKENEKLFVLNDDKYYLSGEGNTVAGQVCWY